MAKKLCVSGALCKMMKFGLVVMLSYSSSRLCQVSEWSDEYNKIHKT